MSVIESVLPKSGITYSGTIIGSIFVFLDILLIGGTGLVVYLLYVGWDEGTYPDYLLASGLLAMAITGSLHASQAYGAEALSSISQQTKKVLSICVIFYLLFLAFLFGLKISATFSRAWVFLWFAAATSLVCVSRVCMHSLLSKWGRFGKLTRNIVVVGAGHLVQRLSEHLAQEHEPWNKVVGGLDLCAEKARPQHFPVFETVDQLLGFAREHRVDDFIVTLSLSGDERLLSVINKLEVLPVNIHLACDLLPGFRSQHHSFSRIGGVPLIDIAHKPLSDWSLIVKEIEDKVIAGILLLALAPLFLLIVIAIKLDSKGSLFFRQPRHGYKNNVFTVFKFRTMHDEDRLDPSVPQARRNDPRVTRVGRVLRRTSLDELPQLFNVLTGSMSLVGPRPHALPHNSEYAKTIEGFYARHRIKPGITGWAQVHGCRGETTPDKIHERVEYDLYYIQNWSLLFDLRILIMTLFVGFVNKNAY